MESNSIRPVETQTRNAKLVRDVSKLCVMLTLFIGPVVFIVPGGAARSQEATKPAAEPKPETAESPEAAKPEVPEETAPAPAPADQAQEPETPKAPSLPPPSILKPYAVEVVVTVELAPELPPGGQFQLVEELGNHLRSRFRQLWNLDVRLGTGTERLSLPEIEDLSDERALERIGERPGDKHFLLAIRTDGGMFRTVCREWDAASRTLGPALRQVIGDRRTLASLLANSVCDAFRPLAELEVLEENKIEFLIRGGEFPPRDSEQTLFQPGDYLVPFMRYLNRSREVRSIQPLPWTYLKVESVERSRMQLSMTSVFKAPIPASRRRVEVMAMRVRPRFPATSVLVYPRGQIRNPLVGYRCELLNRMPTEEDPVADRIKLATDRSGNATIPVDPAHPLQFLYVHSGEAVLARVPVMPGIVPDLQVEVPDDRARLNVEGEVTLLQGELIDIVATREVLMARIRAAATQNKWDDVNRFLKELDGLPTQTQFIAKIDTLQVQAVYAAQQAKDRVAESRIKKLCSGVRDSAGKYLDPFRVTDFKRDIQTMRPR